VLLYKYEVNKGNSPEPSQTMLYPLTNFPKTVKYPATPRADSKRGMLYAYRDPLSLEKEYTPPKIEFTSFNSEAVMFPSCYFSLRAWRSWYKWLY
jgi:hypothetical protein